MQISVIVKYATAFGQGILLRLGKCCYPLSYADEGHWQGEFAVSRVGRRFKYSLFLTTDSAQEELPLAAARINLKKSSAQPLRLIHEVNSTVFDNSISATKPFQKIFLEKKVKKTKQNRSARPTHIFILRLPRLRKALLPCLTGSDAAMGSFDPAKPLLFRRNKKGDFVIRTAWAHDAGAEYKVALYDCERKIIIAYEDGNNRIATARTEGLTVINLAPDLSKYYFRAAGINLPLFSLRTGADEGCGDFIGLKILVHLAHQSGFRLIQLLPINDTCATLTDADSYPYSAISAFALHPIYLHAESLATAAGIELSEAERAEIARLNNCSVVDYSSVVKLKLAIIRRVFMHEEAAFTAGYGRLKFFKRSAQWLVPYAIFCTMRDKFKTPDPTAWGSMREDKQGNDSSHREIVFWYYLQYQLHRQLKSAAKYARRKAIILKADLPIGVGRFSADTLQHPGLFHMDMQAGAPPDAFSDEGQNWKFPTYNTAAMRAEKYAWLRARMKYYAGYFSAIRIDHVLGLFRIWSIPLPEKGGAMGVFVPALALSAADFEAAGISFNEARLCEPMSADHTDVILLKRANGFHFRINMQHTNSFAELPFAEKERLESLYHFYFYGKQDELWESTGRELLKMLRHSSVMLLCAEDLGMVPAFVDGVLESFGILSLQVQQMPKRREEQFSDTSTAGYHSVVMPATHDMAPMRLWWEQHRNINETFLQHALKLSGTAPYFCEPWLSRKIFERQLASPAMFSNFLIQDILDIFGEFRKSEPAAERINDPANPQQVWNYRMPVSVEQLANDATFSTTLNNLIRENGR